MPARCANCNWEVEIIPDKSKIREKIESQMQEFFQSGGRITEIPSGETVQLTKKTGSKKKS